MIFIETQAFTKLLPDYLSDDDYRGLQSYLMRMPEAGAIVRGSGGIRKVRWSAEGKGKSGGVRVMYYWQKSNSEIWMLTIYSKSERATILGQDLKRISEVLSREKS